MIHDLRHGDIVWVDFGEPFGSEPGFQRPAIIMQSDAFNESRLRTTICIPLTTNLKAAHLPGTVLLKRSDTALDRDCVALAYQITTIDRAMVYDWAGHLAETRLEAVFKALDLVLGR